MNLRENSLPAGWYPRNPGEISRFLSGMARGTARAAIAPQAGWHYSGKIAARAVAALDSAIDVLVVIGGHVPAGCPPLFAMEDAVNTPLGAMIIHADLRAALIRKLGSQEDRYADNTVEVLLPMARFFHPAASLVWVRFPAELSSFDSGKIIAAAAAETGITAAVLASTDLTHYGPNYGFMPEGGGPQALRWVREVNDRRFIDAIESGDPAAVLERAETESSSCSPGPVLGAMGFAGAIGCGPARLLEYGTSVDTMETVTSSDSFVGYAAFAF